jgi:glycosyltransferase involved in cell wall biosynthesis
MLLSIIIPVYQADSTVVELLSRLIGADLKPLEKEIIVVGNPTDANSPASQDLKEAGTAKFASNPAGGGKGKAIRIGLSLARGDVIMLHDADVEIRPEALQDILVPILAGESSVVYAARAGNRRRETVLQRAAGSSIAFLTNRLFGTELSGIAPLCRALTAAAAEKLRLRCDGTDIDAEMAARLTQAGYDIEEILIEQTETKAVKIRIGESLRCVKRLLKCRFE